MPRRDEDSSDQQPAGPKSSGGRVAKRLVLVVGVAAGAYGINKMRSKQRPAPVVAPTPAEPGQRVTPRAEEALVEPMSEPVLVVEPELVAEPEAQLAPEVEHEAIAEQEVCDVVSAVDVSWFDIAFEAEDSESLGLRSPKRRKDTAPMPGWRLWAGVTAIVLGVVLLVVAVVLAL